LRFRKTRTFPVSIALDLSLKICYLLNVIEAQNRCHLQYNELPSKTEHSEEGALIMNEILVIGKSIAYVVAIAGTLAGTYFSLTERHEAASFTWNCTAVALWVILAYTEHTT